MQADHVTVCDSFTVIILIQLFMPPVWPHRERLSFLLTSQRNKKKKTLQVIKCKICSSWEKCRIFFSCSVISEAQTDTQKVSLISLMLIRMSLWFKGQILNETGGKVETDFGNDCRPHVQQLFIPAIHSSGWFHWLVPPICLKEYWSVGKSTSNLSVLEGTWLPVSAVDLLITRPWSFHSCAQTHQSPPWAFWFTFW